jgi:hypothetical protein
MGSEFIGQVFQTMIKKDYAIKAKPITVRNPQANAMDSGKSTSSNRKRLNLNLTT